MRIGMTTIAAVLAIAPAMAGTASQAADEPLRIIVFGAHPDDCELEAGGTAALWAQRGHKVKFVSVTNGDIGHHDVLPGQDVALALHRDAQHVTAAHQETVAGDGRGRVVAHAAQARYPKRFAQQRDSSDIAVSPERRPGR